MGERQAGLVFYDKSDLNIAKSKKSEQYIHENSDEHFARHYESHWRETWHHTGTRTEPPIFLETPTPTPGTRHYSDSLLSIIQALILSFIFLSSDFIYNGFNFVIFF